MKFDGDSVVLSFSAPLCKEGYSVSISDMPTFYAALKFPQENNFSLPLAKGYHEYVINPANKNYLPIIVKIDHSAYNGQSQNEFLYCNFPGPNITVSPMAIWNNAKGFSTDEIAKGEQILKDSTNIFSTTNHFDKAIELCKFTTKVVSNPKGIHAYKMSEFRPYEQLQQGLQSKADLACGNYAAIVHYLAVVAGLPNRVVTFVGPAGNWAYGVHYYNEIYLREKQQWVLIDAANKVFMPHDSLGKYYNAADLKKIVQLNGFDNKQTYGFKNDSVINIAYNTINAPHIYYNQSNADLCYLYADADVTISPVRNLIQFYTFSRNAGYYSDANRNNWCKIVIKEVALLSLFVLFAIYLFAEFRNRKSAKA